jgi:hypothetical protein
LAVTGETAAVAAPARPGGSPGPEPGPRHRPGPWIDAVLQVEGEVTQPGGLAAADAVLDAGAVAVAQLQHGDVGVGLVGDEHLEACPSTSVNVSCAPGWVLAAADRPRPFWPAGKLQGVQLGHLGARAWLAAGVDRRLPGAWGPGQHGGADALVGWQADREPHATLP